jgi:ferredoxin
VQILPCAGCLDRPSLLRNLHFTQELLEALGDEKSGRRVAILPREGSRLRRAILAAGRLSALVDSNVPHIIPADGIKTSGPVAAWAVVKLQRALAGPAQGRPGRGLVIQGEGAPLGVPAAVEGCTACGVCSRSCPAGALSLGAGVGTRDLILDPAACTGCRVCVQTCPEGVLDVAQGVDLDLLAGGRVPIARVATALCPDCGKNVPALPGGANLTPLPAQLARRCPSCRRALLVASV